MALMMAVELDSEMVALRDVEKADMSVVLLAELKDYE
jgi:hypothetical protein